MSKRFEIIIGDITEMQVDAIVNAANNRLMGGGGVDGAIHQAAGPKMLKECIDLEGCETGKAKVTGGYNLPAKWVIHTVGPVWRGGNSNEDALLASCYRTSLALAVQKGVRTLAFPSISTGIYRFPVDRAAEIALSEIDLFLAQDRTLEKIIMVCFDMGTFNAYTNAAAKKDMH